MIIARTLSLYWYEGVDFYYEITLQDKETGDPLDLTGYSVKMQARRTFDDVDPLFELSTASGEITIDGPNGMVILNLPAADTLGVEVQSNDLNGEDWIYDVVATAGDGSISRLMDGRITARRSVTQ